VRKAVAWRGAMATQALELHPPIQPSEFILHTCPSAAAWQGEAVPLKGNPRERLGVGAVLKGTPPTQATRAGRRRSELRIVSPESRAWPGEEVALKGNPGERLGAGFIPTR
jgi:hypothetical protein